MLKNLGIVDATPTLGSTKGSWNQQLAARRFGGKRLVEWVVRRVTDAQRLDGVIVVLASTDEGQQVARWIPPDVPVLVSQRSDPLGRLAAAIESYPTCAIVRVGVRNAFVDPVLIDRLVSTAEQHNECDYVSYCSKDGRPIVLSKLGIFAEWCRADALQRANREIKRERERHAVTSFFFSHPEIFQLRLIPIPDELDREDLRLTIDAQEDLDHAEQIFDALGPEHLDWQRIAGLLHHNPRLRERMAALNRSDSGTS